MGSTRSEQGERHPLQSDLGTTTIQDTVVSAIAGIAAGVVEGIDPSHGGTRLPGDSSPTVGSSSTTSPAAGAGPAASRWRSARGRRLWTSR